MENQDLKLRFKIPLITKVFIGLPVNSGPLSDITVLGIANFENILLLWVTIVDDVLSGIILISK